jgi:hypothetical protein
MHTEEEYFHQAHIIMETTTKAPSQDVKNYTTSFETQRISKWNEEGVRVY